MKVYLLYRHPCFLQGVYKNKEDAQKIVDKGDKWVSYNHYYINEVEVIE